MGAQCLCFWSGAVGLPAVLLASRLVANFISGALSLRLCVGLRTLRLPTFRRAVSGQSVAQGIPAGPDALLCDLCTDLITVYIFFDLVAGISPKTAPKTGEIHFSVFLARCGPRAAAKFLEIPQSPKNQLIANYRENSNHHPTSSE